MRAHCGFPHEPECDAGTICEGCPRFEPIHDVSPQRTAADRALRIALETLHGASWSALIVAHKIGDPGAEALRGIVVAAEELLRRIEG